MTDMGIARIARADQLPDAQSGRAENLTLDLWLILRRQRWPLIIGSILGLMAGGLHFATSPDRYYAASVVLIDERPTDPGQQFGASLPILRSETAVLNEMQVLRSLQLAEDVVRDLSLHEVDGFIHQPVSLARNAAERTISTIKGLLIPEEPIVEAGDPTEGERITAVAAKLQRDIGILRVGRSFSIEISMILNDPDLATAIANSYARAYLADRQAANREASSLGAEWVRENIAEVRERADEAASELAAFRAANRASDPQGLRELEQRVNTLNELHATLLRRLETVAMEASYPISNGRLLSQAITPRDPALPKAWRLLAAGLILGLIAGIGMAVLRELRETSIRTGEDVRSLTGLPFLGYLPTFRKSRVKRLKPVVTRAETQAGLPTVSFLRAPARASSPPAPPRRKRAPRFFDPLLYLPSVAPDLPYNDRLKGILARLDRMAGDAGCVAAISSVNAGEGRTTLAANLAQFAALSGCRTLLIDADLHNPSLSRQLGFRSEAGLGEVLADKAPLSECVIKLETTGLDVLPYVKTRAPEGQTGMLRLARHLKLARDRYDLVLLDTQPLGASTDVNALLSALDAVVLVADWGNTPRAAFADVVTSDPDLARKTAGVVLNRTVMSRLRAYGVLQETVARSGRRTVA